MLTIVLFAAALAIAITVLTVVVARRRIRTRTPEGLATERAHTTNARAVGGIWGVHGAGVASTAGRTAQESTRTFH